MAQQRTFSAFGHTVLEPWKRGDASLDQKRYARLLIMRIRQLNEVYAKVLRLTIVEEAGYAWPPSCSQCCALIEWIKTAPGHVWKAAEAAAWRRNS